MTNVNERALVPSGGLNGRFPDHLPEPQVPEHTIDALIGYVEHGRPVGSFLSAVLTDDLSGALRSTDDSNRQCLEAILQWLWNTTPADCYGSEAKVAAWKAMKPTERSVLLQDVQAGRSSWPSMTR